MDDRNKIIETHYRKNYKTLVKRMTNRVPHHSHALAEELVQEAYVRALQYYKTYDTNRPFERWFSLILNNAASDQLKYENGTSALSLNDDEVDLEPFILNDEMNIPREVVMKVQEAIKDCPPDVSEVLNMFFNLGMRTPDIEKCTRFSHSNIRQIIRRFRIKWDNDNIFKTM